MISHCDSCRWVTQSIKTMCPYCGRGIDLDFEHTADYYLSAGYKTFEGFEDSEEDENEAEAVSAASVPETDSRIVENVFNDNFANFCGTSAIEDEAKNAITRTVAAPAVNKSSDIVTAGKQDGESRENDSSADDLEQLIASFKTSDKQTEAAGNSSAASGDFGVRIDSSAIDSFRIDSSYPFSEPVNSVRIDTGSSSSSGTKNRETNGDFGTSSGANLNTRDTSYEDEYERQRRAALARERREAFFDRLRAINPRTVFTIVAVVAVIGFGAYVWSMREVIIEGITNFLTSLIPPAVIIIILVACVRSLFRRR